MKRNIISSLLFMTLFFLFSCAGSQVSSKNNVLGRTGIDDWMFQSGWDITLFQETTFDKSALEIFNKLTENQTARFIVFANSGCLDCAKTLPYFLKLLKESEYNAENIFMIGLDDYWEEPEGLHRKYRLNEIPVVFIEFNGKTVSLRKTEFSNFDKIITTLNDMKGF